MKITYPAELPVTARRADIAEAIAEHQVVIVAGETGSGKTTQLPKICLELGRGAPGEDGRPRRIGHTQPRRIAARAVAERIADELGTDLGDVVGYQVRFTDQTSRATKVKVMTDGILLAELQRDRDLRAYDTLIIDEAHERSLNIDFLLGYLKGLLPRRPDLKVVITSATIDPERFAAHFADARGRPAPIIEVSGRTYPVEIRYRPLRPDEDGDGDTSGGSDGQDSEGEVVVRDQTEAIADAVTELSAEGSGDILVFLPGEREIRDTADALADLAGGAGAQKGGRRLEVLPLYGRLSAAEQHRVFSRHQESVRRVVLATNVAETSLTVPGIRYVVDTGVARISRYSARTKVQRLPIERISQASANQRSGRCGRVADGVAIRLYSEEDFESRPEFTDPEILRTNLASVILQMASLRLGKPRSGIARFGFLDPPETRNVTAGVQLLEELGALNGETLTKTGRRLARLPIDPRLGRMILEAERRGCVREVIVIAAALSLQDPRERPEEFRAQADQQHARFTDKTSDFLTWLNLWRYLKDQQQASSSSAFRRMCRREYLNYLRVREWQDFESQLRQVAREMGVDLGRPTGTNKADAAKPGTDRPDTDQPGTDRTVDADNIHQSLLSGLLSQIGALEQRERPAPQGRGRDGRSPARGGSRPGPREYAGARGTRFAIFPGSGLKGSNPEFLMAGELVETGRLWARQNAAIKAEWAERLGSHLVQRSYSEPHWSKRRAAVLAHEKVTLYGVPLVADRLVNYARIDAELSRELFIRHALVYGEWHTRHEFFHTNRRLLAEAEELEHRARRRDIVVDEHTLFDFYDARVGAEAVSGAHFDTWWKQARRTRPDLLTFDPAMLTHDGAGVAEDDFPSRWHSAAAPGLTFDISYHFEPGAVEDGLTIEVPVATLNQVDSGDFSWLVPGLREELVTSLIRSLPKALRVNFVPAPNTAREFLARVPAGEEPLLTALQRYLRSTTGVHVPDEAWEFDKLPEHLRPTFRVTGDDGREAARGKDLDRLKAPLRQQFDDAVATLADEVDPTATGQRTWTFGDLPDTVVSRRAGHEVRGIPVLVEEVLVEETAAEATVGLGVFGAADEAAARHRGAVGRLLWWALRGSVAPEEDLDTREKLALAGSPYGSVAALLDDLVLGILLDVLDAHAAAAAGSGGAPWPRTAGEYAVLERDAARTLVETLPSARHDLLRVLAGWRETEKALSGRAEMATLHALTDMRAQTDRLVHDGFLRETGARRLRDLPRYLEAVRVRRERLDADPARDRVGQEAVRDVQDAYLHQLAALPPGRPPADDLRTARWMLEEFRVSLFAQHLGTSGKVSDQRIRRTLAR